ncbi:hypothetical protein CSV67_06120 [Sporosarcina sp. P2]|nr:hypothetical protein CSV67_06120 [Sporosarcina sp. P2]
MPNSNDVPDDIKVINYRLFIITASGIWTRNLKGENGSSIQVDKMVVGLIKRREIIRNHK